MPPITLHFTPTAQDYTKTLRAFYASNRRYWFVMLPLALMLLPLLCTLPAVFVGGNVGPEIIPPLLLAAFFPALLGAAYALPLFQIGRQVAKNERLRAESTCTLDDEGITISTRFAETRMDWGTFSKMLETREHVLLIYALNKNCFQIFPKRAFQTAEQEADFRDLVRRHISQYQDRQKGMPRWLIIGAVMLLFVVVMMGTFVATYTKQLAGTWTAVGLVRVDSGALLVADPSYLPGLDDDLMVRLDGVAPGEYSVEVLLRDDPDWGRRPWRARVLFKPGARGQRKQLGEAAVDSATLSVIDPAHLSEEWTEVGPRRDGCLSGLDKTKMVETLTQQGYRFGEGKAWCIPFTEPVSEQAESGIESLIKASGLRAMLFISTGNTYDRLVDAMEAAGGQWGVLPFADGRPGLVTAFESGAGDGSYLVYELYDGGRLVGLEIDMR